jgi:tRNA G37 N-methylase Trm5
MLEVVPRDYLLILLGFCLLLAAWVYLPVPGGAPWVPTSVATACEMLRMAEVKPGEVVVDMGAGDGRIDILAAREFGAKSVGVEIDPLRCLLASVAIALLGLRRRARVHHGNMFTFDVSEADVVVLYLLQGTNQRIKGKLTRELHPGARVVSHAFWMSGWVPSALDDRREIFVHEVGRTGQEVRTRFV